MRGRKKGRIRELEEIRSELAEKELVLLGKEQELLAQKQSVEVLKEEVCVLHLAPPGYLVRGALHFSGLVSDGRSRRLSGVSSFTLFRPSIGWELCQIITGFVACGPALAAAPQQPLEPCASSSCMTGASCAARAAGAGAAGAGAADEPEGKGRAGGRLCHPHVHWRLSAALRPGALCAPTALTASRPLRHQAESQSLARLATDWRTQITESLDALTCSRIAAIWF